MSRTGNCSPEEMLLRVLRVAEMIIKQEAVLPHRATEHPDQRPDPKLPRKNTRGIIWCNLM
ncbi:MAG: hypothetical protein IPK17_11185 [Chloroflexi bacterium]|uniref:hypothetical protein n=1 Tax=Candidatus Flexifilum breve TaxID=3140694 RepID=UPI0031360C8A|nr:hypothetical protein [Chloroflexota bacterium]